MRKLSQRVRSNSKTSLQVDYNLTTLSIERGEKKWVVLAHHSRSNSLRPRNLFTDRDGVEEVNL